MLGTDSSGAPRAARVALALARDRPEWNCPPIAPGSLVPNRIRRAAVTRTARAARRAAADRWVRRHPSPHREGWVTINPLPQTSSCTATARTKAKQKKRPDRGVSGRHYCSFRSERSGEPVGETGTRPPTTVSGEPGEDTPSSTGTQKAFGAHGHA